MSLSVHRVVVWEYKVDQNDVWVPYSPCVSQLLERAYGKNLTHVLLQDADPTLAKYEVNLITMSQSMAGKDSTKTVRRCLYSSESSAAKGVRWEWQTPYPKLLWKRYTIDVQTMIEQAWCNQVNKLDLEKTVLNMPYVINFTKMTHYFKTYGVENHIRRKKQAPYPLLKLVQPAESVTGLQSNEVAFSSRSDLVQQTRAGHVPNSTSGRAPHSEGPQPNEEVYTVPQSQPPPPPPPPSSQGKFTQMFNNIFGTKSLPTVSHDYSEPIQPSRSETQPSQHWAQQQQHAVQSNLQCMSFGRNDQMAAQTSAAGPQHATINHQQGHSTAKAYRIGLPQCLNRELDNTFPVEPVKSTDVPQHVQQQFNGGGSDAASSHKGRRPSVDTVSTYLTNESQTSSRHHLDTSEFDALNCSMGSDDVFMAESNQTRQPCPLPVENACASGAYPKTQFSTLLASDSFSPLISLRHAASNVPNIVGITHEWNRIASYVRVIDPPCWPRAQPCPMCMEELQPSRQKVNVELIRCKHLMHLGCLNMLLAKQRRVVGQRNCYIECPICMSVYGVMLGNQPIGSMSFDLLPGKVPGYPATGIYEITYDFCSGIQTPRHPNPGHPFFAVGFPRRCYLPNIPLGTKILDYLKIAFQRGLLFTIGCSTTTGIEDVILWSSVEHKTHLSLYPDTTYLDRCLQQLVHLGVTD